MEIFWFLPTSGDEQYLGSLEGRREPTTSYLRQIVTALDDLGYGGVFLPSAIGCEEAWVTAAALLPATERLRFLVAIRPGVILPSIAARMSASLDRISEGRLLVHVVTGAGKDHLAAEGVFVRHDSRYELTEEFLTIWRGLMRGETVDFTGRHLSIREGRIWPLPVQQPYPPLYFAGSSAPAIEVAARHADVYLSWGEPPHMVREKIDAVRRSASAIGRTVKFGLRLHVVVRSTEEAAWAAAEDLLRYVTDEQIASVQANLTKNNSEGQRRMQQLHRGRRTGLEVSPNLWAGIGLVRPGAGTALVGSPKIVAERLKEYADLGIENFILSGYPHLEEAYRFAELVFPLIPNLTVPEVKVRASERTEFHGWWSPKETSAASPDPVSA